MPCIKIHKPPVVLDFEKCYVCGPGNLHADMSRDMRFPTMWYVRPAKAQTRLRICAD